MLIFLSGDYPLQNSINAARLEGRYLAQQGKPWDLMAWGFSARQEEPCRSTKSVQQLKQEAAIVLALGGGFRLFQTKEDGSINNWEMKLMREVAKFAGKGRSSAIWLSLPQIALLLSTALITGKCSGFSALAWRANSDIRCVEGLIGGAKFG